VPTFGNRPDDVLTDSRGNVQSGVALKLYASQADATTQTAQIATATSNGSGRWPVEIVGYDAVWVRDPNGNTWLVESETFLDSKVVKGAQVISVKDYGAKGDGSTNDTASIQSAINAAVAGPKRLFFPPGTYIISGSSDMLTATAGLEMFGPATIKVKNANGRWNSMFNTLTNDASGLWIHNLTWDGNATNNQPVAGDIVGGNYPSGQRRIAVRADYGSGITVERCTFNDHDCTWVFISANSAKDVRVLDNQFTKIGNLVDSSLVHDHSTVYVDAIGFEIKGNLFTSTTAGATTAALSYGAVSPIDTHGSAQKVHHNTVIGYIYGGQLSVSPTVDNVGVEWHHNTVLQTGHGLHITPSTQGMRGVEIHNNVFEIDYLTWKSHPWQNGGCGIAMNSGSGGPIERLSIRDNLIKFVEGTYTGQSMIGAGSVSNGIQWVRREAGFTAVDKNIAIKGNTLVGSPDNGIYARFSNIDGLDLTDNVIRDAASTANADGAYSVGVYVDAYTSATRTRVDRNRIRDTQKSGVAPYGNTAHTLTAGFTLWSAAGTGAETATDNSLEVADGVFVKFARELATVQFNPPLIRTSGDYMPEHAARTTLALTADTGFWVPIRLGPGAITQFACEITVAAASSTIETALYRDVNGRPGARIYSTGSIDSSLTSWRATPASSYPLAAGVYWVGFAAHGGGPTITMATGRNSLILGPGFTGATSTDLTAMKSAGPHTSLPPTAPTASLTYGQGPLFYAVGA